MSCSTEKIEQGPAERNATIRGQACGVGQGNVARSFDPDVLMSPCPFAFDASPIWVMRTHVCYGDLAQSDRHPGGTRGGPAYFDMGRNCAPVKLPDCHLGESLPTLAHRSKFGFWHGDLRIGTRGAADRTGVRPRAVSGAANKGVVCGVMTYCAARNSTREKPGTLRSPNSNVAGNRQSTAFKGRARQFCA